VADDAVHELTAAYALDALEPAEARAYERHLAHCERCQGELATLAAGAVALAFAAPEAEPPAELRGRILAAARAERPNVAPLRPAYGLYARHQRRLLAGLAVAASAAAVGLGIWNVVLHQRLDQSHQALRNVAVRGAAGSVLVGGGSHGTLVLADLASPPAGKTYEAWVIDHGHAQPAGLFGGGKAVVVRLTARLPHGAIVGVTVERAAGARQPTSAPIITSAPI